MGSLKTLEGLVTPVHPREASSAALFRTMLDASSTAVAILRHPHQIEWANVAFSTLIGRSGELAGQDLFDAWPIDHPNIRKGIDEAMAHHRAADVRGVRVGLSGRGKVGFIDVEIRPVVDPTGADARVLVTLVDVTERTHEHERAGLFYQAFLSSTNAMEITDREGNLVDVNPAFESIYGYSRAETIGKRPNLVRSRKTSPDLYVQMWKDLLDPARGYWSGDMINRDRNGRERPVFLTITAIRDETGVTTHYLGVAVDLTEQRAWEQAAARADKLASLGQLAAGVAHEINTPLANVMLVAESIRRKSRDEWVRTRADTIRSQVKAADRIVLGLLDFARRAEPHVGPLDLRTVAQDAVAFVKGKQSQDVDLEERYPEESVEISGDRNQLLQVLANVLNNAYDAIEGNGRIALEIHRTETVATVDITDSGGGIPPEVLPHLFEPFFTTKTEGKGTGLGLAICHGIMQGHHGTIVARNAPEGGARFTLTFPAIRSKALTHESTQAAE